MHRECRLARAFMDAFNSCDSARLQNLLARDAVYVDSTNEKISGRDNIIRLIEWLHSADPSFRKIVEECTLHRGLVLMTGQVESKRSGRSGRVLFEILVDGSRIKHIQSFRREGAIPLVKLYRGAMPRQEVTLQQTS